jgi:hypothetical protein
MGVGAGFLAFCVGVVQYLHGGDHLFWFGAAVPFLIVAWIIGEGG